MPFRHWKVIIIIFLFNHLFNANETRNILLFWVVYLICANASRTFADLSLYVVCCFVNYYYWCFEKILLDFPVSFKHFLSNFGTHCIIQDALWCIVITSDFLWFPKRFHLIFPLISIDFPKLITLLVFKILMHSLPILGHTVYSIYKFYTHF